jgi:potassium/hydrogen antiporter
VLSATDPAVLVPVLLPLGIRPKVVQTLVAESAVNDPTGAVLALGVAGVALGHASVLESAGDFAVAIVVSTAVGVAVGLLLVVAVSSHPMGLWRDSGPLVVLCALGLTDAGLSAIGASGYLGCFLAGLLVGNAPLLGMRVDAEHFEHLRSFARTAADGVTMVIFLLLGASLPVGQVLDDPWPPVLIVLVLVLVARPVTVLACTLGDRSSAWTPKELAFLCWSRETGVVPAALVGLLAAQGVADVDLLAGAVGLAIVVTLLTQALPARALAGRLGLLLPGAGRAG